MQKRPMLVDNVREVGRIDGSLQSTDGRKPRFGHKWDSHGKELEALRPVHGCDPNARSRAIIGMTCLQDYRVDGCSPQRPMYPIHVSPAAAQNANIGELSFGFLLPAYP